MLGHAGIRGDFHHACNTLVRNTHVLRLTMCLTMCNKKIYHSLKVVRRLKIDFTSQTAHHET